MRRFFGVSFESFGEINSCKKTQIQTRLLLLDSEIEYTPVAIVAVALRFPFYWKQNGTKNSGVYWLKESIAMAYDRLFIKLNLCKSQWSCYFLFIARPCVLLWQYEVKTLQMFTRSDLHKQVCIWQPDEYMALNQPQNQQSIWMKDLKESRVSAFMPMHYTIRRRGFSARTCEYNTLSLNTKLWI